MTRIRTFRQHALALAALSTLGTLALPVLASSHREAPFITTSPKVDATDFYMFRSYEADRSDYVTLIANYVPLQDAYGGPNYFAMDPNALYEIHLDNNGDAKEDITFQFRFKNTLSNGGKGFELPIGDKMVASPLIQFGGVSGAAGSSTSNLNLNETYSVNIVKGDRRKGAVSAVTKAAGGASFEKPVDYIGVKTLGNPAAYETYAALHRHDIKLPSSICPAGKDTGRVFVGQRQDGFAVALGPIFDLVNATAGQLLDPNLKNAFAATSIQDKNVTSIAIEVHKDCLTAGTETIIGGWTTASLRQGRLLSGAPKSGHQTTDKNGGAWTQVSRLGNPLVNEVVIGLKDKDKFNASKPVNDAANFATYVTNPTLPALLGIVLVGDPAGVAPTNLPRTDLVTTFLTGINTNLGANGTSFNLNQPTNVVASEMLRLNTAVAPVAAANQNRLGVVGSLLGDKSDLAGFPNGRRPKDDVVDIALIAMLGGLCVANTDANALGFGTACKPSVAPLGASVFGIHDGVDQAVVPFLSGFPYLNTPNGGTK
jgi:Domain of unknown function (DUF4331)